jgi:rhodanese-related sulfurtransferase
MIPLLIMALFLLGCKAESASKAVVSQDETPGKAEGKGYTDLPVEELQTWLANKDFTFINVHIPFEGNIANTDLSIPYNEIEQNVDQLPAEKAAKIVLYCRSGHMSSIAAAKLDELGYTNVWNMAGGMAAWDQAGFPLEGE